MRTRIQKRQVELYAARVVGRLEWVSPIELGTHRGFPLLGGHEGVVERSVGAEVEWGLLVGYGSTEVRGI